MIRRLKVTSGPHGASRSVYRVSVRYGENEQREEYIAQTRDISARGICFYVDSPIQADAKIDFTLTLPPEITLTETIRICCKGRVVRVEGGTPASKMAVAAGHR